MPRRTGSKTDKILYLFGKRTKTVEEPSSEDGSSDGGNERFPVTRGLQTGRLPTHNPHQQSQHANHAGQSRPNRYNAPSSHNGPSNYETIHQEHISKIPPAGSANYMPLNQLPHVVYAENLRRTNPEAYRRLSRDTSRLPPLSLSFQQPPHQPPLYTPVPYQSAPRQADPQPTWPTRVNPETYHYNLRATSRRDQDLREDEDEASGRRESQLQAQQGSGMVGRTNVSGTKVHQKTSAAEIGNMNRTFIQGFDTPPAGSKNVAHLADDGH